MEVMEFKNIIWEYTRKISENSNIAFTSLCEQYGLTLLQVRILVEIKQHEFQTIGSLASRINMAGTNLSTMCKKLETKGFLERARDQGDERVVKVVLSEKGKRVVAEIDQQLVGKITQYLKEEPGETLDDIIRGLKKLNDLLERIGETEK